jgi:TPR repeat protein
MIRLSLAIAAMTLVAVLAAPAGAETATGTSAKPSDTTEITIFAARKPAPHTLQSAQQEMAATDPHSRCAFYLKNRNDGRKHSPNTLGALSGPSPDYDVNGGFQPDPNVGSVISPQGSLSSTASSSDYCERMASEDAKLQMQQRDNDMPDAYAAYQAGDYAKALALFIKAYNKLSIISAPQAPSEYGMAQTYRRVPALAVMVARMYLYGQGTPPDTAKAIEWFKKAAAEPSAPGGSADVNYMSSPAEAAMYLARIYETGTDVPVNPKEARHWYLRAADLDYIPAWHLCGLIYRTGYGGEQNMAKAMDFFIKAGTSSYPPSQYILGEIYYLGEDGIPQDKTRAGAWLLKAAKNGYPDALFAVGRMYDLGEGGAAVDPAKALLYYKEAAVKGQPDAENAVGLSFYTGNGLAKDPATARQWFEKAAENANVDAMFNLAVMLINGEGGDRDLVKAWVWLKIAVAGGHPKAAAALAELEPKMTAEELARAKTLFQPAT